MRIIPYTIDDLDKAIKVVVPVLSRSDVWKQLDRPTMLNMAIIEVFVEWDICKNKENQVVEILRSAKIDLNNFGQFIFKK